MMGAVKKGRGLFITGTDTGVGKTLIAAGIAKVFQRDGVDVTVMKPFSCGDAGQSDVDYFVRKLGLKDPRELLNPFHCKYPLAPSVASRMAGQRIDVQKAVKAYRELSSRHELTIVEGVGGLLVPITNKVTVLDFIAMLKIPVIIVARSGLGTINHTALTVESLRRRKIEIAGIVMNGFRDGGLAEKTNPKEILRLTDVPVIARVPWNRHENTRVAALSSIPKMLHL